MKDSVWTIVELSLESAALSISLALWQDEQAKKSEMTRKATH